jgi:hypothetical protein
MVHWWVLLVHYGRRGGGGGGVRHIVALPFTFKKYINAKRRIMETQIFHHAKI